MPTQELARPPFVEVVFGVPPELIGKLLSFARLPHDWNSYGSPPISLGAIAEALGLLVLTAKSGLPFPQILPAAGGGVHLEWADGERQLELQTWGTGTCDYVADLAGNVTDGEVSLADRAATETILASTHAT